MDAADETTLEPASHATQHGAWVLALLLAVASLIISFCLIPPFSPTNDDAYIQQSLSGGGGVSAYPTAYTTAINFVLGWSVSRIYLLFPGSGIPWWTVFQLVFLCLSIALFNRTALTLMRTRGVLTGRIVDIRWSEAIGAFALLLIDVGFFGALVSRLQFTNTASLLSCIPIFSTCCWHPEEERERGGVFTRFVLPIFLASLGFSYRSQSGYLGLLFWTVAVASVMAGLPEVGTRQRIRSTISCWLPLVLTCLIAISLTTINAVARSLPTQPASNTYRDFSTFVDYPHPSFEDDPELYESVGWDATLSPLVESWFMLDDRINEDSLSALAEASSGCAADELVSHPIATVVYRLRDIVQPTPLAYLVILFLAGALAIDSARLTRELFVHCSTTILSLALLGYLLIQGRLPERAALSVYLPAITYFAAAVTRQASQSTSQRPFRLIVLLTLGMLIFLPLSAIAPNACSRVICVLPITWCGLMIAVRLTSTRRASCRASAVLSLALLTLSLLSPVGAACYSYGWSSPYQIQQKHLLANTNDFFSYSRAHDDTLFIYSHASITMQFVWLYDWPENQVGWGGWYYGYAWFDEAMQRIGLDGRPTSEDLFSERVRFVSASDQTCQDLLAYLRERYGTSVSLKHVDNINDEIKVYAITRDPSTS